MATDIHVGDVGTSLRVTVKDQDDVVIDISDADVLIIKLRKPDGETVVEKVATLVGDGTDGILEYVTEEDDLDESGRWRIQAYLEIEGAKHHSEVGKFQVDRNLN